MARNPAATASNVKPDPEVVRAHLARILESPAFRGSKRSSDFLRYVVEQSLEGRLDALKERSLGVAVFERPADYDTNQDPIVRNTAGQVRRRLAQFYQEAGDADEVDGIRIEMPSGSYVPELTRLAAAPTPEIPAPATPVAAPVPPAPAQPRRRNAAIAIALGCAALALIWWVVRRPPTDVVTQFWEPVLRQPGNVVVCVGQGHTYKLAGDWDRRWDEAFARGVPMTAPGGSIPLSDVLPVWPSYAAMADVQAVARLAGMFGAHRKPFDLRGGRTTALEDLRRKPVVLVGALNNDWTLKLTGELRFYFESTDNNRVVVRDRQRPGHEEWSARVDVPISQATADYAIVTRVFNKTTEQSVVVAAGLRGAGTEAAGEFLTRADYLEQALAAAGPGWQSKNLQFVIMTRLFSGRPGPPTVVAKQVW